MARVGNEAKLILRLAEEKTEVERLRVVNSKVPPDFVLGYESARNDYKSALENIVSELEAR